MVPLVDQSNLDESQVSEPTYEMTYINKIRFSDDRLKFINDRDNIREKRAHYMQLRMFIFETIHESNKVHLYNCIASFSKAPIGNLVEIFKTHRKEDQSAQRMALYLRLQ